MSALVRDQSSNKQMKVSHPNAQLPQRSLYEPKSFLTREPYPQSSYWKPGGSALATPSDCLFFLAGVVLCKH